MKAIRPIVLACALLMLLDMAPASAASAPIYFCNKSANKIAVAVGYHSPGVDDRPDRPVLTGPFVSRGWYELEAGACTSMDNPFHARYMFWYGWGKGLNDNEYSVIFMRNPEVRVPKFCVKNYFTNGKVRAFTFEPENASIATCDATPDALWVIPKIVDTWVDPAVNFTGGDN